MKPESGRTFLEIVVQKEESSSMTNLETLRIEQIDAHELDGELRQLLLSQLQAVAKDLPAAVASWMDRLDAELRLLVDAILWTLRVYKGES